MSMTEMIPNYEHQSFVEDTKLIVNHHFRLCKAKYQKRKFIQKQNKQEIFVYKQKMLRLVKKRSNQIVQQTQKRIEQVEKQLKFHTNPHINIIQKIENLEQRIRQWLQQQQLKPLSLIQECKQITKAIEDLNDKQKIMIATVADRIQQICLESISQ